MVLVAVLGSTIPTTWVIVPSVITDANTVIDDHFFSLGDRDLHLGGGTAIGCIHLKLTNVALCHTVIYKAEYPKVDSNR